MVASITSGSTCQRAPNELATLCDYSQANMGAWLDLAGFDNVQGQHYWTSTTLFWMSNTSAYYVHMYDGDIAARSKTDLPNYVWAVRQSR